MVRIDKKEAEGETATVPFSHTIDANTRMVRVLAEGPITLRDCFNEMVALAADPAFEPNFKILADVRSMEYEPTPEDISCIVSQITDMKNKYMGPIAMVVLGKSLEFHARLVAALTKAAGLRITVFTDMTAAEDSLK